MFGHVKNDVNIIDRLLTFFNSFNTDENVNILLFTMNYTRVSYDFIFKWFISKDEFQTVADFLEEELEDNQKTLHLEMGQYYIELELYPDDNYSSDNKTAIDNAIKKFNDT